MSTGLFQDEEDGYNLEEETKYKLKLDAPKSEPALGASGDDESLDGLDDLGLDDDLGGDDLGDNLGGNDDKPFDDEPFDAGVEADETEEPEKYIQQLAGKLGTTLRKYTEERGQPDFELEKFAINSVISATNSSDMDEKDKDDIIKKINTSGNEESMDLGDDSERNNDLGGDLGDDKPTNDVFDDEGIEETNGIFELNDLIDLKNSEKNDIFAENLNIMDYVKDKVQELLEPQTEPITKPTVKPVETPSPRRRRIWSPKPAAQPKPKATK